MDLPSLYTDSILGEMWSIKSMISSYTMEEGTSVYPTQFFEWGAFKLTLKDFSAYPRLHNSNFKSRQYLSNERNNLEYITLNSGFIH